MFNLQRRVRAILASLLLAGTMATGSASDQSEKSTGVVSPKPEAEKAEKERQLAAATEAAKQLLLAMDMNKSGKISKEEWMKFMEAEFDRLDTDHKGQLDVNELTQSRVRMRPYVGK
jgi:Mrp family chromosome partitioning ATPase